MMDLLKKIRKLPFVVSSEESLIDIINSGRDDEAFRILISGKAFSQDELDRALILACNCRFKLLVYKLVRLGADVETKDAQGNTPLLICAELHSTNVVRFLLGRKVNINAANKCGNTALILATRPAGSVELIKLLLMQKGLHVNHQNKEQDTALMKAIESKNFEIIKLLLDSQENTVKILDEMKNSRNETAQEIADKLGVKKIGVLLSKLRIKERNQILAAVGKCDINSFVSLLECQLSDSLNKKSIINDTFRSIFTAHEQSGMNFKEKEELIIQRLLECGADVNGGSSWFHPVLVATQVGSCNVLQMLLKHGAHLDKPSLLRSYSNPLRVAVENNHHDLVTLLLKNNSETLLATFGNSALECALRNGHTHCAKLLVQHGVVMDVKYALSFPVGNKIPIYFMSMKENRRHQARQIVATGDVRGLVICAKSENNVELAGVFLPAEVAQNYADKIEKSLFNKSGKAAILNFLVQKYGVVNRYHSAYRDDNSPIVQMLACNQNSNIPKDKITSLLKRKSNVNKKSFGGRTPLMVAVSNRESTNIVQLLLDHGADVGAMNSKGSTALLLAVESNHTENILCLLQNLKHRSILDLPNHQGLTSLMIATVNHNYQVMEALIGCKAGVNVRDRSGNTALLLAVARYSQELEILNLHVSKQSLDQPNRASFSSYMKTGEASVKKVIRLLVSSGADVNVVNKKAPEKTALTLLLENSVFYDDILESAEYLLDHGAKASYAPLDVIHALIQLGKLRLIPKLLQCGFGPATLIPVPKLMLNLSDIILAFSPLCVALLTQNVSLARYFVGNLFMTQSDASALVHSIVLRLTVANFTECLGFLNEISAQPMSLFSLAFIAVQSTVGPGPGREKRIQMLPIPQPVINLLLFKSMTFSLEVADDSADAADVEVPKCNATRAASSEENSDSDSDYDTHDYMAHEVDSSDDDYWMNSNEM